MYAPWVPIEARGWSNRKKLISQRLLQSDADIICLQEVTEGTFLNDFDFLLKEQAGYDYVLHKKFRFRCATFYKRTKFELVQVAHKDRVLITSLRSVDNSNDDICCQLNVMNCHLSGGAVPKRRLKQIQEGIDQLRKWKNMSNQKLMKQLNANRPSKKVIEEVTLEVERQNHSGTIICGDFNSDGNTGVRKYLVDGYIDETWTEPQYPNVQLTTKSNSHDYTFQDSAELAYGSNVCDGDYGECIFDGGGGGGGEGDDNEYGVFKNTCRPATYVVPNLAAALLMPLDDDPSAYHFRQRKTEFGPQLAQGLAATLGLKDWCQKEIDVAFERIDIDGSGRIDEEEIQMLLEDVYIHVFGREEIEKERRRFFNLGLSSKDNETCKILTKTDLKQALVTLQKEIDNDGDKIDSSKKHLVSAGIVETLGLETYCQDEIDRAFRAMDLDDNGVIDEYEVDKLLKDVYINTYGRKDIEEERKNFFQNLWSYGRLQNDSIGSTNTTAKGLTKEQISEVLMALLQEIHGGTSGSELVTIETEADTQRMVERFTPALLDGIDQVFDNYSTDGGISLTEDDVEQFLLKTNGQLGRGGTWRHTQTILDRKRSLSDLPAVLSREDFYSIFANELAEGKWWQVVYDLEICGVNNIRPMTTATDSTKQVQHYQGWLDYIYFDNRHLKCTGYQEPLTESEFSKLYDEGDAFPNEWHPSDHLPLGATYTWHAAK